VDTDYMKVVISQDIVQSKKSKSGKTFKTSGKTFKTSGKNRGKSALSGGMEKIVGGGIRTGVKRADKVNTFLKRRKMFLYCVATVNYINTGFPSN